MRNLVEKKAEAIADGVGFSVSNIIWEMVWIEAIPDPLHQVLMGRGILKALWYISEHLYLDAFIKKGYLLYTLQQDLTLGNQQTSGATDKTLRELLKEIVDQDDRTPGFGWLLEAPARSLMEGSGYSDDEMTKSGIRGTNKYITHRSDRARNNLSAIRQTAISVHRTVTARPFTDWLVAELSDCDLDRFDVHSGQVLNSYERRDGCRHRFAKLIRADLRKYGYQPSPDENDHMRELRPADDQPTNPRKSYKPGMKPEPIYFRALGSSATAGRRKAG